MKCASCLGEGQQLALNSMFIGDGYRRERCGICAGSGQSDHPAWPGQVSWQKEARHRDTAMRVYRRDHPTADYIELGRAALAARPSTPQANDAERGT